MGGQADIQAVANFLSAMVGNNADILSARFTPSKKISALRITCALGTAAQFGFTASDGSATTPLLLLENADVLTANNAYTWTIGVRAAYSYQFKAVQASSQPVKIQYLSVEEVSSGEI